MPRSSRSATRRSAPRPRATRSRETQADRHVRAARILAKLTTLYPDATCALDHAGPYELLVAVILSAQCTDERVNKVTPQLFRRYPTVDALAAADPAELEAIIKSTGFFRNKTRSLLGMAQRVCSSFGGQIPPNMEDLLSLPGVARKTANCILGTAYGLNAGIVVDTHVGRLALRLKLLTSARDDKDAVKIERDLMPLFPNESWTFLSHALIQHGRAVCIARSPSCDRCVLASECPSAFRVRNGGK
ncbi:Ultraviolet N-glycosylase/AP lyase [Phycisphaerae bacterium RAS1]|nr:Ultraviolet N-glycosylase/AP lyase [Phycisphaerae bacterium RAS1]